MKKLFVHFLAPFLLVGLFNSVIADEDSIPSTISGKVTDSTTGLPLTGIQIKITNTNGTVVAWTYTNSLGEYIVGTGLIPGSYYVNTGNAQGYIDQVYQGLTCANCDVKIGSPVTITSGDTTRGINFALLHGGIIAGKVTDSTTGLPLTGIQINITNSSGAKVAWTYTNSLGEYIVETGLIPGSYYVNTGNAQGYIDQVYQGLTCANCDVKIGSPVTITSGDTTREIDFALHHGGSVSGKVTDGATGLPLPGVTVHVFTANGEQISWPSTNDLGEYATYNGLAPGTYYLYTSNVLGYLDQVYNHLPCEGGCTINHGNPVLVTSINSTEGINFILSKNHPPVSNVGENRFVSVDSLVQLDGSLSHDPDNDTLSFFWFFVSKPEGSVAALAGPDSAHSSFIPDLVGEYVIALSVRDHEYSDTSLLHIIARNYSRSPVFDSCLPSIISYWSFDNPANIGKDLIDTNDGIPRGNPQSVPGIVGNAVQFDGVHDYLWIGKKMIGDSNSFSLEMWVNFDRTDLRQLVVSNGYWGHCRIGRHGFDVQLTEQGKIDFLAVGAVTGTDECKWWENEITSKTILSPRVWYHVAVVRDLQAHTQSIYINGKLETRIQEIYPGYFDDASFNFGGYYWPWPDYIKQFAGKIDEAALYRRPLTDTEVRAHYYSGKLAGETYCYHVNEPPVAKAGEDQIAVVDSLVRLDGDSSYDPESDPIGYNWFFISKPVGSTAAINDAAKAHASFVPDSAGEYVIALAASDATGSDTDQVLVNVMRGNPPAVAWVRLFGSRGGDQAQGVVADSTGNVYVVGQTDDTLPGQSKTGDCDAFIAKYDMEGNIVWLRQYGLEGYCTSPTSIALDKNNNLFVAATQGVANGPMNSILSLTKYNSSGDSVWRREIYNGADASTAQLAIDNSGNILITGSQYDSLSVDSSGNYYYKAFVCKYDNNGDFKWSRTFASQGGSGATCVGSDSASFVYVAGNTTGSFMGQDSIGSGDPFLAKLDSSGNILWIRQFGTPDWDDAYGLAIDKSGMAYIGGQTDGNIDGNTPQIQDYGLVGYINSMGYIRKYDSDGEVLWTRQFTASWSPASWVYGLATDSSRNVYAAGGFLTRNRGNDDDIFVSKWNSDGVALWTKAMGSSAYEFNNGIALDNQNNVLLAGYTEGQLLDQPALGADDAYIIKLRQQPPSGLPQNHPPVANAGVARSIVDMDGNGSESVLLDGSSSADADGSIVSYSWSEGPTIIASGVNPQVTLAIGTHTIRLIVIDDDGASDTDQVIITINSAPIPVITNVSNTPQFPNANQIVVVRARITDASGLTNATLNFRYGEQPWQSLCMTDTGNDGIYDASIAAPGSTAQVQFFVSATNKLGRSINGQTYSYIADQTPPTIASVTISPNPVMVGKPVALKANASDNAQIISVTALIDGTSIPLLFNAQSGLYESSTAINISGMHQVEVTVTDAAGNNASETALLRVVDNSGLLAVNATTDRTVCAPGEPLTIRAVVTDNNNLSIPGAIVNTVIRFPDGSTLAMPLFNDGVHNDVAANDGVYANSFVNASQGTYTVTITAQKDGMLSASGSAAFTITYRDLAIIGGTFPGQEIRGNTVRIDVDIRNYAYITEQTMLILFDSTDNSIVDSTQATLAARADNAAYLNWITDNASLGTHRLAVNLRPVPEETSLENNVHSFTLTVNAPVGPTLVSRPDSLGLTMNRGQTQDIEIMVTNTGDQTAQNVSLQVSEPYCASMTTGSKTLAPGAAAKFVAKVSVPYDATSGSYPERLMIACDNASAVMLPLTIETTDLENAYVKVHVHNTFDTSIAGATVVIRRDSITVSGQSDAAGNDTLSVAAGTYTIYASKPGFYSTTKEVTLSPNTAHLRL